MMENEDWKKEENFVRKAFDNRGLILFGLGLALLIFEWPQIEQNAITLLGLESWFGVCLGSILIAFIFASILSWSLSGAAPANARLQKWFFLIKNPFFQARLDSSGAVVPESSASIIMGRFSLWIFSFVFFATIYTVVASASSRSASNAVSNAEKKFDESERRILKTDDFDKNIKSAVERRIADSTAARRHFSVDHSEAERAWRTAISKSEKDSAESGRKMQWAKWGRLGRYLKALRKAGPDLSRANANYQKRIGESLSSYSSASGSASVLKAKRDSSITRLRELAIEAEMNKSWWSRIFIIIRGLLVFFVIVFFSFYIETLKRKFAYKEPDITEELEDNDLIGSSWRTARTNIKKKIASFFAFSIENMGRSNTTLADKRRKNEANAKLGFRIRLEKDSDVQFLIQKMKGAGLTFGELFGLFETEMKGTKSPPKGLFGFGQSATEDRFVAAVGKMIEADIAEESNRDGRFEFDEPFVLKAANFNSPSAKTASQIATAPAANLDEKEYLESVLAAIGLSLQLTNDQDEIDYLLDRKNALSLSIQLVLLTP